MRQPLHVRIAPSPTRQEQLTGCGSTQELSAGRPTVKETNCSCPVLSCSTGHIGLHGHEFLEFEYSAGRLRYANNSNYRNDSLIKKESEYYLSSS